MTRHFKHGKGYAKTLWIHSIVRCRSLHRKRLFCISHGRVIKAFRIQIIRRICDNDVEDNGDPRLSTNVKNRPGANDTRIYQNFLSVRVVQFEMASTQDCQIPAYWYVVNNNAHDYFDQVGTQNYY